MEIKTGHLYHIKDDEILWFIPLSSKVKNIRKILNEDSAILFQNAFPTLEK